MGRMNMALAGLLSPRAIAPARPDLYDPLVRRDQRCEFRIAHKTPVVADGPVGSGMTILNDHNHVAHQEEIRP